MERKNGSEREKDRPVHEVRYRGRNCIIKVPIWRNMVDIGQNSRPMYNCEPSRSYKERDSDEWKDTNSVGYDDLLVLAKALNDAHSWIAEQIARDSEDLRQSQRPTNAANNRRERQTTNA